MNQETNDFLIDNLVDAHNIFNTIISEMQDANIDFQYDFIKEKEHNSFEIVNDLLVKMNYAVVEYEMLKEHNVEFFNNEYEIYIKYFALYVVSIVFIKVFHDIFSTEKFNEFWHYLVGLFLGSTFMGLLNSEVKNYRSGTKDAKNLVDRLKELKEEYKNYHDQAVIEIDYIFALNDNLWDELDKGKKLVKIK